MLRAGWVAAFRWRPQQPRSLPLCQRLRLGLLGRPPHSAPPWAHPQQHPLSRPSPGHPPGGGQYSSSTLRSPGPWLLGFGLHRALHLPPRGLSPERQLLRVTGPGPATPRRLCLRPAAPPLPAEGSPTLPLRFRLHHQHGQGELRWVHTRRSRMCPELPPALQGTRLCCRLAWGRQSSCRVLLGNRTGESPGHPGILRRPFRPCLGLPSPCPPPAFSEAPSPGIPSLWGFPCPLLPKSHVVQAAVSCSGRQRPAGGASEWQSGWLPWRHAWLLV